LSIQHTDQTARTCPDGQPQQQGNDDQLGPGLDRINNLRDIARRQARASLSCLASFLFAVALVRAGYPFLLTAVLPVAPAVLAIGLGDGERAVI
jgi:hypothetical protein